MSELTFLRQWELMFCSTRFCATEERGLYVTSVAQDSDFIPAIIK
jgi:hypothetical protein